MAELRLAMLGMGKAMSSYLSPNLDKKGLEKVRDGLLEAGGGDVEDLVKEWAWHEGLERSSAIQEGHRHEAKLSTPVPGTEVAKAPPSSTNSLNTPRSYTSSKPPLSPVPTPPLTLSSRTDTGPLASLPRVPQTAHLSRVISPARATTNVKSASNSKEVDPLGMGVTVDQGHRSTKPSVSSDPLGVGP